MAKKLRYGTKKLTPVRTLVVAGDKTLAPSGSRALTPSGSRALKTVEGRTIDVGGRASQGSAQASGGKGKAGKVGKVHAGGSMASRTDEEEESGSGKAKAKKPKGVVMSSSVVSMLTSLGVARAEAERMVLSAQLSQSNPRVGTVGPVNRRDGGAGFGRGRSGGGGQRTAAPPPGEKKPGKPLPPLSAKAKAQQDALNSQSRSQRDSGIAADPVSLEKSKAKISKIFAPPAESFEVPPSYSGMKASWVMRGIEDIVRSIGEPEEMKVKKLGRATAILKKAFAEREIGKFIDALTANQIEFETPEEKAKTYSELERMIRKIQ